MNTHMNVCKDTFLKIRNPKKWLIFLQKGYFQRLVAVKSGQLAYMLTLTWPQGYLIVLDVS